MTREHRDGVDPGIFTYAGIRAALGAIAALTPVMPLRDWHGQPGLILRHDVDLDILPAVRLAEQEAEIGLRGTFFFLTTCETYNPAALPNRQMLRGLSENGFEVGLHFDPTIYPEADDAALAAHVAAEGRLLEDIVGAPVRSISLHNPSVHGRYPMFEGWRNAYDAAIFTPDRYLSDSRMLFREDPVAFFRRRIGEVAQLLLHPLHYSPEGSGYPVPMAEFVRRFVDGLDRNFIVNRSYRDAVARTDLWTAIDGAAGARA